MNKTKNLYWIIPIILVILNFNLSAAQSGYYESMKLIVEADFSNRQIPPIPGKDKKIRVIIDSDAKNEVDDQWAIALALLSPERLQIEGFVAANFDNNHGGPSSVDKSYDEILILLDKMNMNGDFPVFKGSHPMKYKYEPSESEGVNFIIETAMKSTPEDPIWIVALGSATNLASAYLKEPRIAKNAIFFWHGRTRWPDKCWNFNVFGDPIAARTLFHSPIPFILFDTGTYLTCPMDESEKMVRPYGEIGKYIHDIRLAGAWYQRSDKGFFDLGDIAVIVDPDLGSWKVERCPEVGPDFTYDFKGSKGKILRCYDVDRDGTFKLLYDKLAKAYGN